MRKTVVHTLLVAALILTARFCPAQTMNAPAGAVTPLVTIAFAGYDELKAEVDYVGQLVGNPQLSAGLEGMMVMMTQGNGLKGIDAKKPWGGVVQTDGQAFSGFGFLPTTKDFKQNLFLAGLIQQGKNKANMTVEPKGDWLFLGNGPDALKNVPADPTAIVGDLLKKYALAVRASVKNVPAMYKQMAAGYLQMATQQIPQMPGETAEAYGIRANAAKQAIQQAVTAMNELDEILLGLNLDRKAGVAYLDLDITAIPGTAMAQQMAKIALGKSDFAGFTAPGAALTANWTATLSDADVARAKTQLAMLRDRARKELKNQGLGAEEQARASQIVSDLLDVLTETVEKRKADAGAVVILEPGVATLAFGGLVADGAKLDKVVKQLVAEAGKEEPEVAKMVKLDAENYQGIRFHTAEVPVSDDDAAKLLGKTTEVVVGIGDQSLYVAAGRNALKTLKQMIDQSKAAAGKEVPPLQLSIAATPIARVASEVGDEQAKAKAKEILGVLSSAAGQDHVTVTSKPIPNGVSTRVQVEKGILMLLPPRGDK